VRRNIGSAGFGAASNYQTRESQGKTG